MVLAEGEISSSTMSESQQRSCRRPLRNANPTPRREDFQIGTIDSTVEISDEIIVNKSWRISDFDVGEIFGQGEFGESYYAKLSKTGQEVLLKRQDRDRRIRDQPFQLNRELRIHSSLKHSNIQKLLGYFHSGPSVYVILEYGKGGTLQQRIELNNSFTSRTAVKYVYDLSLALIHCHRHGVIHRAVSPMNVILTNFLSTAKLSGFDWAIESRVARPTEYTGTYNYAALEMIARVGYDHRVDIWSLGVLLFEMLAGESMSSPTKSDGSPNQDLAMEDISFPDYLSSSAQDILTKMLQKYPPERISLKQVLTHSFIVAETTPFQR